MKNEKIINFMREAMDLTPNFRKGFMDPSVHSAYTESKLSQHQMFCLMAIHRAGIVSMGELAKMLGVTNQQITRTMDGLVEHNFVERFTDSTNRRVVQARISEAGKQFFTTFQTSMQNKIAKTLEVLTEEEIDECIVHMKALSSIFQKLSKTIDS